jgi:hypothetical protein
VIAAVHRPHSYDLPLLVHVLGAILLFGGVAAAAILAFATSRRAERAELARATFRVLLVVVLPAWVLMRGGGQWIQAKEDVQGTPTWMMIGLAVAEPGLLVLLLGTGCAFWSDRRGGVGWQPRAAAGFLAVYALALAVAWWTMAAKPGAPAKNAPASGAGINKVLTATVGFSSHTGNRFET